MATAKISLTLDDHLLSAARDRVGRRGLSRYVNQALRHQLQRDRVAELLAELEREEGPIEPHVMEDVRQSWPAPARDAARIEVPVVVVAETTRGGSRDAPVNRVLKAVDAVPAATGALGRIAGRLLGKAKSTATVDALVVAQAVYAGGAHVLTSDPDDLEALAAPHPEVWIQSLGA